MAAVSGIFNVCMLMHATTRTEGVVRTPKASLRIALTENYGLQCKFAAGDNLLTHRGVEPASVLRLAFRSDVHQLKHILPQLLYSRFNRR